ncbi:TLR7 protein, partial [Polypterus senegalus]|nr:toll-like receptor 7 [Polypterus senegalus]MBN3293189.1 TLR7 protein [Polypterus senegalus]
MVTTTSLFSLGTFVLLCFSFTPAFFSKMWYPKSLPCDVLVENNGTIVLVECKDRQLTEIPKQIPKNATNLTFTTNHISEISQKSFHGLMNLTEIDFRCNCVPIKIGPKSHVCTKGLHVQEGSFAHLPNLKSLYLDGNQLSQIPQGLPPTLTLLSLEVNSISSIYRRNLSELTNLETLYLGKNCYYRNPCNVTFYIETGAFSSLNRLSLLSLKSNNITSVPQMLPTSLKELYLYNNGIEKISKTDFQNLTSLEVLDLSGNCPRCFNAPFPCTPCPNDNPLFIHPEAFNSLRNLSILRLHSNSLKTIESKWFYKTTQLKILDLSSNFLADEIRHAQFLITLKNLEELDLSFNYKQSQYSAQLELSPHFANLVSLRVLRIKGYVFKQLNDNALEPLMYLKKLEIIDLGTNFIKQANLNILQHLKAFKIINLSENKISPSGDSLANSCSANHSDVNLLGATGQYYNGEVREIQYFQYDEFARSCTSNDKEDGSVIPLVKKDCSTFGKTLDLSRNNIFFIDTTQFRDLHQLKCLNLSGNAMSQTLNGSEFTFLSNLEYLDFSSNRIDLLYSSAFQELKNLKILDLSHNDHYFVAEGVTHMLNFTKSLPYLQKLMLNYNLISTSTNTEMESSSLEILEFKGNRLDILWKDGDTRFNKYFSKLYNVTYLDLSYNSLTFIPQMVFGGLPPKLREWYLNNNELHGFNWGELEKLLHLEILDLSNNKLTTVPRELSNCTKTVQKFILKKNQIPKLTKHFLKDATSLRYLDLSFNELQKIEQSSFPENIINNLEVLILNGNKFMCTCDTIWFVLWINKTSVNIPRLATDVTCAAPGTQKGRSVIFLDQHTCQMDSISLVLHVLTTFLTLMCIVTSISCHLFFWDVWYSYHYCIAKLKGYHPIISEKTCYDAYVAYDKKDPEVSDWVLNELLFHLENKEDIHFQLCLDERDWVPGLPLIDNLSQSIQLSRKTVFLLTNKYILSGIFKTSFYLAHQRLIDEKEDVIILVFLEKVRQSSKYVKLRKRLCRGSVLEWPNNPQAQGFFWQSLKSVLATDNYSQYNKLFKESI